MTEPKYSRSNPDFSQTIWPTIEAKTGRKLTADENERFMYRGGGMFKEWFFNALKDCNTPEQAEDLLARALQRPWPSQSSPEPSQPEVGLFRFMWGLLWEKLRRKQ